jgi:hypothetical protein
MAKPLCSIPILAGFVNREWTIGDWNFQLFSSFGDGIINLVGYTDFAADDDTTTKGELMKKHVSTNLLIIGLTLVVAVATMFYIALWNPTATAPLPAGAMQAIVFGAFLAGIALIIIAVIMKIVRKVKR